MPRVDFSELPDDARLWVFAADRPVMGSAADGLLVEVDSFLDRWVAHGQPLTCARDWRDDRFLAVAVDQRDAHASGCSIDGMFRVLKSLEPTIGASLLGGGRILYRDRHGHIRSVSRDEFGLMSTRGEVSPTTPVFDTTVATARAWRSGLERPAAESWHAALL